MIKKEDLQIGDWVYIHHNGSASHFAKVTAIYENGFVCWLQEECEGLSKADYIEPIPLTPEILEKNGFRKSEDGFWPRYVFVADIEKCPQTVIDFSFYGENVSGHTLLKCWTRPQGCDGENNIHICDLKYVHQLQRALRLCGIEKEIEL